MLQNYYVFTIFFITGTSLLVALSEYLLLVELEIWFSFPQQKVISAEYLMRKNPANNRVFKEPGGARRPALHKVLKWMCEERSSACSCSAWEGGYISFSHSPACFLPSFRLASSLTLSRKCLTMATEHSYRL